MFWPNLFGVFSWVMAKTEAKASMQELSSSSHRIRMKDNLRVHDGEALEMHQDVRRSPSLALTVMYRRCNRYIGIVYRRANE